MRASSSVKCLLYFIVATVLGLVVSAKAKTSSTVSVAQKTNDVITTTSSSKRAANASFKYSSSPVASPKCTPSAVVNAHLRNGAFDDIPINPGASTTHEPPWYFDRLSNAFGRFRNEPPSAYSGGGAAAFHITGQPPGSFAGYAYLNTPITYCNSTPYTLSLSARQLPPNSLSNQICQLRAFTSFQGSFLEIGRGGSGDEDPLNNFAYDGSWRRFGPVQFSIFRDNGEFNAGDRTWNDTFSIIVQCFGVVGKPVPKEVVVEVDGVVIDKA